MRLFFLLALFLCGCTSVSEYYSPEVKHSDWMTVGSCGNKFEVFKLVISDGITIEMVGPYLVLFRLSEGKTIQFKSNEVKATNLYSMQPIELVISNIKTGVLDDFYRELYGIEEVEFGILDELKGTGRYKNMDMKWGEWSAFRGKRDIFRVVLSKPKNDDKFAVKIELPEFLAQGKLVHLDPIVFRWKKGTSLACVQ